jgi:hypothetical protein
LILDNFYAEKPYQKTIRILVYPNITWQRDLEQDSYVQVLKNMIRETQNEPFFWHIISPNHITGLSFDNTEQLILPVPTYPPTMRSHFDVFAVKRLVGHDKDFDIIMSHLPEHTHQLVNTIHNLTHHVPKVIGYAHWFDFDRVVAWHKGTFRQNITGLLEYDRCYINTQCQKNMVLQQAKDTFNDKTINKLDKILKVQHLGVAKKEIVPINKTPPKTIVFNHRCSTYKNFKGFISIMDKLYEQRQDFTVWAPLFDGSFDKPYLTNEKYDKQGYYDRLKDCYLGFAPKQKYGGWSVAATDGMMNGCPYIFYDGDYYHELQGNADFFITDDDALELMNKYLDDKNFRNKRAVLAQNWLKENLLYSHEMSNMCSEIKELLVRPMSSPKVEELIDYIKSHKSVTKKELFETMGWGRGIKWSPYRRALMNHPNIFDTSGSDSTYNWKE